MKRNGAMCSSLPTSSDVHLRARVPGEWGLHDGAPVFPEALDFISSSFIHHLPVRVCDEEGAPHTPQPLDLGVSARELGCRSKSPRLNLTKVREGNGRGRKRGQGKSARKKVKVDY